MNEEQNNIQNETEPVQPQSFSSKQYRPVIGYGGQFAILIGLAGVGIALASIASIALWVGLTHTSIFAMEKNLTNPAYSKVFEIIQVVETALMFFLPAILLAAIVSKNPFKYLGFNSRASIRQFFLVTAIALVGLLISQSLGIINEAIPIPKSWQTYFHQMEDTYNDAVQAIATMKTFGDYLIALLIIAIIPAIIEESFFRSGLQQIFVKWFKNVWIGIIVVSIIFSAFHLSYYGFLSRAALGIILGFVFYYGKNIWLNAFVHFINNGIAITAMYILTKSGKSIKEIQDDNSLPFVPERLTIWAAIILLMIGIYIVWILFKELKKESIRIGADKTDVKLRLINNNPFEE